MEERSNKKRFLIPIASSLVLVAFMIFSVVFMRQSLMTMTVEERTNQLEEMVSQIQANLSNGLQTHWNLVEGLNYALNGKTFGSIDSLCEGISSMEDVFCLDRYGSQVMLLDSQGTGYLRSGSVGIWNDVIHLIDGDTQHTFVSETFNIDGCFLVFSRELDSSIVVEEGNIRFTHVVLLKDIKTVKQYYTTSTFGGNAATYFIKSNGVLAYYDADEDDVIGARNVFKALKEVEYLQDQNFYTVKGILDERGLSAADIKINGIEYLYCMTSFDAYDMILMLLVPADKVAVNTMNMMNSTVKTELFFIFAVIFLMMLASFSFVRVKRSRQMVELEQKTNKELNQLRIVAETANAAKSTFLNNMSHDIRTPMNAIIGFTNIALKQQPSLEIKGCLEKIRDSSEHLLALINDVLDISRIESGKIKYTPTAVDICQVSESVLSIVYGYLANRSITFKTEFEEPMSRYVLTDSVRIRA